VTAATGAVKADKKQLVALGVLAVIAAAVLYWQFGPQAGTTALSSNQQAAAPATAGGEGPAALPKSVDLQKLEPVPGDVKTTRDPFRFGVPPPPPAPPYVPPPPAPPPPPPQPTGPPPKPPIPLKFIGREVGPAGTLASLSDGKGSVFLAREGDIVDGQYRLVKIGMDTVTMEYLDGTGSRIIRFGGAP
jgi:hypothetical protein